MSGVKDITGKRFGRLVVTGRSDNEKHKVRWICKCDCGNETIVTADSLLSGKTKSCGCLRKRVGEESHSWKGGLGRAAHGYLRRNIGNGDREQDHRVVVEKALGEPIPPNAVVHHIDENKENNSNNNLVLCEDRAYHNFLHMRLRALKACGHANWIRCCYCKEYDDPKNLYIRPDRLQGRHVECHKKYMEEYHKRTGK